MAMVADVRVLMHVNEKCFNAFLQRLLKALEKHGVVFGNEARYVGNELAKAHFRVKLRDSKSRADMQAALYAEGAEHVGVYNVT